MLCKAKDKQTTIDTPAGLVGQGERGIDAAIQWIGEEWGTQMARKKFKGGRMGRYNKIRNGFDNNDKTWIVLYVLNLGFSTI